MKAYYCDACGSLVFFENVTCLRCNRPLGFLPDICDVSALEPGENGTWKALASTVKDQLFRRCLNGEQHQICNWMVAADDPDSFCAACKLNDIIPDLKTPANHDRWQRLEMAKRRVVYTIRQLGLPTDAGSSGPALQFRFLGDVAGQAPVLTGHAGGVITINVAEADDAERERRRVSLHEPYRTLLGHLRHEVGHYYWDRLVANSPWLNRWRATFGDESRNYSDALNAYYQQGPPTDWQSNYVSAYASVHPWEDWAESWAHYFHIIDTLETAASFGLSLKPKHPAAKSMTTDPNRPAGIDSDCDSLLENWFPLTYVLNALNRGMGLPDLYPFVLSSPAIEKLRFVHELVQTAGARRETGAGFPSGDTSGTPVGSRAA